MTNNKTCIYPDCPSEFYSRGLCIKHYGVARRLVNASKTTWEKLEASGKVLKCGPRGVRGLDKWFIPDGTV